MFKIEQNVAFETRLQMIVMVSFIRLTMRLGTCCKNLSQRPGDQSGIQAPGKAIHSNKGPEECPWQFSRTQITALNLVLKSSNMRQIQKSTFSVKLTRIPFVFLPCIKGSTRQWTMPTRLTLKKNSVIHSMPTGRPVEGPNPP